jgi:hypothetical protein
MIRRVVPLVMVLTIALCPVTLEVCQVTCSEHDHGVVTPVSAGHHHHAEPAGVVVAHHHGHHTIAAAPPATSSTAIRSGPHGCLHGEDLPAFVGTNLQIALAPAVVTPMLLELPGPTFGTRLLVDTDSVVHSPPITLTTQLRV